MCRMGEKNFGVGSAGLMNLVASTSKRTPATPGEVRGKDFVVIFRKLKTRKQK